MCTSCNVQTRSYPAKGEGMSLIFFLATLSPPSRAPLRPIPRSTSQFHLIMTSFTSLPENFIESSACPIIVCNSLACYALPVFPSVNFTYPPRHLCFFFFFFFFLPSFSPFLLSCFVQLHLYSFPLLPLHSLVSLGGNNISVPPRSFWQVFIFNPHLTLPYTLLDG